MPLHPPKLGSVSAAAEVRGAGKDKHHGWRGSPGGQLGPPSSAPCSGESGPCQGQPLHVTSSGVSPGGQRGPTAWDVTPQPSLAEPDKYCGSPGGQQRPPSVASPSPGVDDQHAAVAAAVAQARAVGRANFDKISEF